jgi:hypothetical protein
MSHETPSPILSRDPGRPSTARQSDIQNSQPHRTQKTMNLDEFIFDRIKELAEFQEWFRQFDDIGDLCPAEWDEQLAMFRLQHDKP